MIKGTNKQVLEVTNTENPYFEKIIFFVKPEYVNAGGEKLKKKPRFLQKRQRNRRAPEERSARYAISAFKARFAWAQALPLRFCSIILPDL